jgi:outer membrane protein OmpA-like peptidoglycan-associated protein
LCSENQTPKLNKMKKITLSIMLVVLSASLLSAQGLFNKIKNKVKSTVENRTVADVDKKVNKTIDEIEGKGTPAKASTEKPLADTSGKNNTLASYSKYDFVPGDSILYAEDFATEAIGELPTGWNTNGKAEVVTLNNFGGNWLKLGERSVFLSANTKEFTKNFTIEYDVIFQLSNSGQYWPRVSFGFLSSGELSPNDNELVQQYNRYQSSRITYVPNLDGGGWDFNSDFKGGNYIKGSRINTPFMKNCLNKIVHMAMQAQGKRLRIWVNGEKLYDLPAAVAEQFTSNQLFIEMNALPDPRFAYYISNIKIATGLPDTRHKLIEEGKFSTTGILFDVNSATIRPESYGALNEIADALKKYPDFNVKIIGHTDSDGSDAFNLTLSQKRAAAVKNALAKDFEIDESRMTTEGKGESMPVGDNKTKEGKMQNRRVEFVKQ